MNNSLKNKLKNQYENLSEMPSQSVWDSIEDELDNHQLTMTPSKQKLSYWKIAAVVLVLISLGFLFKMYFKNDSILIEDQMVKENKFEEEINKHNETSSSEILVKNLDSKISENDNLLTSKLQEEIVKKSKKSIEKKSESLVQNQSSIVKKQDTPRVINNLEKVENKISVENHPIIAENTGSKEKTKYVTAEDLLFEREASKTLKGQQNDHKTLGTNLKIQKPKEIKILGVTVYSEDKE